MGLAQPNPCNDGAAAYITDTNKLSPRLSAQCRRTWGEFLCCFVFYNPFPLNASGASYMVSVFVSILIGSPADMVVEFLTFKIKGQTAFEKDILIVVFIFGQCSTHCKHHQYAKDQSNSSHLRDHSSCLLIFFIQISKSAGKDVKRSSQPSSTRLSTLANKSPHASIQILSSS